MKMDSLEKMRVMTSSDKDWIDEILDDEECSLWQISFIEQLLITSAANFLYQNTNLNDLTYNEAEEIIKDLRENNCPQSPQEQYKLMCKAGVFNETPEG